MNKLWTLNIGLIHLSSPHVLKKTNDNTFYIVDKNGYLLLFHSTDNANMLEPVKINLNIHEYDCCWFESIKNDIYIYAFAFSKEHILIYNLETKQMRIDYNFISNSIIHKMGNMIVTYEEYYKEFIDFTTNEQICVTDSKNNMIKQKTYDLFFQFE